MTTNKITEIINSVNSSPSSIYSKEDVLKIIGLVETECSKNNGIISREEFENLVDKVRDIKNEIYNLEVDDDDIDFRLDGREIIVSRDIDIEGKEEVESKVEELIDDMENFLIFPELKDNEVQVCW